MAQARVEAEAPSRAISAPENEERERVFDLFRRWGYLQADLDPLGFMRPQPRPELQVNGPAAQAARRIYCGTIGAEFQHIADVEKRRWIQQQMESTPEPPQDQQRTLERLIRADL